MAVALPKSAKKIHELIGRNNRAEQIAGTLYYYYLKVLVTLETYKLNRRHEAPINPFKLVYVDPGDIKAVKGEKPNTNHIFPKIVAGDWDQESLNLLSASPIAKSIKKRIEENLDWEDTVLYQNYQQDFEDKKIQYAKNTDQEFDEKLARIDELYNAIKRNGYKTQRELTPGSDSINDKIDHHLREFNDVTVNLGRDGTLLLVNGLHRVTISQILSIEKIPVRILVRHKKWQQKRNIAVKNPENLSEKTKNHPDIKYLVN